MKAKKDFFPSSFIFCFCLNQPLKLKWYFAFFLEKFSIMKSAKIKSSKKNDNLFAKAKSSKAIQELYIPVVKVFIEKKSTAPNSARVSIATNDKPAIIAGRADGKIIEYNVFNFVNPRFLPNSIIFCD